MSDTGPVALSWWPGRRVSARQKTHLPRAERRATPDADTGRLALWWCPNRRVSAREKHLLEHPPRADLGEP
jgi:hypothetical protein